MGNILRILSNREEDSEVFVDFENCKPSPEEEPLWNEVNTMLKRAQSVLTLLQKYEGASTEIREAISNHSDDSKQQYAWNVVQPLVEKLKECYTFGLEMAETVPKLLLALCSAEMTVPEHLEKQQALFKQFADILDFVLRFDDIKMLKPSIQNDFSFYRRSCSRRRNNPSLQNFHQGTLIREDLASKMSMFYAEATPMLKVVSKYTSQWMAADRTISVETTTECLTTMAQICRSLVMNQELRKRIHKDDTLMLCLRVMTAVIILYDHIDPEGVFKKTIKLDVRGCIRLLKDYEYSKVESLLNAIRYSTLHFNDDSTPKAIKQLLPT